MAENGEKSDFTIYLEGHDGHQGNVLAHAFITKVHRLILVLGKLERTFIDVGTRQTDFEIIGADKRNPTTLTLKPVPRAHAYNPRPALQWGMEQIAAVGRGEQPDARVRADIANDLVELATKRSDHGYKRFWVNGHAERVSFDDEYLVHATKIAKERLLSDAPGKWRVGSSLGTITGELRKIDDLDAENEFVIVPPSGPDFVRCVFPKSMRDEMGQFVFKTVRVTGVLYYGEASPFPYRVETAEGGIERYPAKPPARSFEQLRGVFAGLPRGTADWDNLLNG